MKKLILSTTLLLALGNSSFAQIGIGTTTPKASLDITGDQGMLLPRMADHTKLIPVDGTLNASEKGLLVFNTTTNKVMLWNGTAWIVAEGTGATVSNGLTKTGTGVIQMGGIFTQNTNIVTDNFDLNVDANTLVVDGSENRVGIGTATPNATLAVNGNLSTTSDANIGRSAIIGNSIELSTNETGNRNSFIDMHASDGVDYSSRIIRTPGVNGELHIVNTGAGATIISGEGSVRIDNLPTGKATNQIVTVDSSGNLSQETRMLAGTLFIGEVGTETEGGWFGPGDNGTGGFSNIEVEGDFLSATKINACSSKNDACFTVMLPNMGDNKYIVMPSFTSVDPETLEGIRNIDRMSMTPPIVYSKTPTSFKIFVEEDRAEAQANLRMDILIYKYE